MGKTAVLLCVRLFRDPRLLFHELLSELRKTSYSPSYAEREFVSKWEHVPARCWHQNDPRYGRNTSGGSWGDTPAERERKQRCEQAKAKATIYQCETKSESHPTDDNISFNFPWAEAYPDFVHGEWKALLFSEAVSMNNRAWHQTPVGFGYKGEQNNFNAACDKTEGNIATRALLRSTCKGVTENYFTGINARNDVSRFLNGQVCQGLKKELADNQCAN